MALRGSHPDFSPWVSTLFACDKVEHPVQAATWEHNHCYDSGLSFHAWMEPAMKVADILRIKGSVVKTVPPHETALLLSGQMRAEQIGALVVSRSAVPCGGTVFTTDPLI